MYPAHFCVHTLSFVRLCVVRLWHERPSAMRDQRPQSVWPGSHREERENPSDHQRRKGGRFCHRWEDPLDSTNLNKKQASAGNVRFLFFPFIVSLLFQCGRLVTWCPWTQMACQTRMLNWNWFQTQRATANRRLRPSAQHSIPSGMRASPCESLQTLGWKIYRVLPQTLLYVKSDYSAALTFTFL